MCGMLQCYIYIKISINSSKDRSLQWTAALQVCLLGDSLQHVAYSPAHAESVTFNVGSDDIRIKS